MANRGIVSPEEFLSVHIFYNSLSLRPVIVGCVDPLVASLTSQGMLSQFFFVRYWENGMHLRLRLRPADARLRSTIRKEVDSHTERFLKEQPSFFDPDPETVANMMRQMYEFEHGKRAFIERFGENGSVPLDPNNSVRYVEYKPEIGRYGGPLGVELAHEHFHISSQLALRILSKTNNRIRTMILGLAFQLMIHFAYAFYRTIEGVKEFFRHYAKFFDRLASQSTVDLHSGYEMFFERQKSELVGYVSKLESTHAVIRGSSGDLSDFVNHAYEMYAGIRGLHERGELAFNVPIASFEDGVRLLLTSYVHMMNNRLGVIIFEEVYLANIIHRALEGDMLTSGLGAG